MIGKGLECPRGKLCFPGCEWLYLILFEKQIEPVRRRVFPCVYPFLSGRGESGVTICYLQITKKKIIMAKKSNKFNLLVSIVLILVGCVLACSSIIPNDYVKLIVVLAALAYGLYGIMKALSSSEETDVVNK